MPNWVTWLIFGLVILALVGFLVFTFVKDKIKNRKIVEKKIEIKRATIKTSKELAIRIYSIIEKNNDFLKMVIPGSSKIKMKHVNSTCRRFLKEIYDSKPFKLIYIESDDADPDFAKNMNKLIETNSNLWNKYCINEIEYFKQFDEQLKNDNKYKEIKEESIKFIDKFFNQEVGVDNEFTK